MLLTGAACLIAIFDTGAGAGYTAQQEPSEQAGVAIPGAVLHGGNTTAMTSPFSNWAGGSDAESQVNQARMKALGKRRKSHKKIVLEVVEEADKEGEEGALLNVP